MLQRRSRRLRAIFRLMQRSNASASSEGSGPAVEIHNADYRRVTGAFWCGDDDASYGVEHVAGRRVDCPVVDRGRVIEERAEVVLEGEVVGQVEREVLSEASEGLRAEPSP
jgi:hypothetical protein